MRESARKIHGGEHAKGKRKKARPFSSNKAIHIVMRSERAKGSWSFRRMSVYGKVIEQIERRAKVSHIRLYNLAVNGNHIHFLIRAKTKAQLQKFLRAITGCLARFITGARRGNAKGKFWDGLTFSRIIEWGKDFQITKSYVIQNVLEAEGAIPYQPRSSRSRRKEKR